MKLKTLKDLATKHEGYEFKYLVSKRRVKREAIKIVNERIRILNNMSENLRTSFQGGYNQGIISEFMRFFNINEVELLKSGVQIVKECEDLLLTDSEEDLK